MDGLTVFLLATCAAAIFWIVASYVRGWETSRLGRIVMATAAAGWILLMLFVGTVVVLFMFALTRMGVP